MRPTDGRWPSTPSGPCSTTTWRGSWSPPRTRLRTTRRRRSPSPARRPRSSRRPPTSGTRSAWPTTAPAITAQAVAALKKSDELGRGREFGFNAFFLALCHWQLGDDDEARRWFDDAVRWMTDKDPTTRTCTASFRTSKEAEALVRPGGQEPARGDDAKIGPGGRIVGSASCSGRERAGRNRARRGFPSPPRSKVLGSGTPEAVMTSTSESVTVNELPRDRFPPMRRKRISACWPAKREERSRETNAGIPDRGETPAPVAASP